MNPKALAVTTSLDLSRGRRPSIEAELQALRALARSTDGASAAANMGDGAELDGR